MVEKVNEANGVGDAHASELHAFSEEITDFFHAQTLSPEDHLANEEVCQAFSDILLRHWELDCIVTFMRAAADEPLAQRHEHVAPDLDATRVRAAAAAFAASVERASGERQVWLEDKGVEPKLRRAFGAANLRAGIGVPIYADAKLPVGVLVVMTKSDARLREAIDGVRLTARPIMIAMSNAQRVKAIGEQRQQIEQLVEKLKRSNGALKEANQELQSDSRYRSLFLARMSHELRTPLTSILGFAEILLDQEHLTDTQRRFCEKIQSSGLQLQTSVKQLVDLSRLEAGQTEVFLHEFSLRETLRESCAAVTPLARKRDVSIDCQFAADLPPIVSDEGKLRQIFYNFFAYAINRSQPQGRVVVRTEHRAPQGFVVTIRDEGETIKDLSIIFEPISVSEAESTTGTNLNDLGLSIARRLIDALGGVIRLSNEEPRGLRLDLDLPARPRKN